MNDKNKYFAGFIMTYNRSEQIENTINSIFDQTLSPLKLLVVDNSDNSNTEELISNLDNPKIIYLRVGHNSGPAGAAKIGLEYLVQHGFDWVYWGDDDDPPIFLDEFQELLCLADNSDNNIAAIGSVGSKFNYKTGLRERFKDSECDGVLDCDSIGGNHNLIINAKVIRNTGIYPNPELFFGFEEFEFLQRLKLKGFRIVVKGNSLLKHRVHSNRLNINSTRSLVPKKSISNLKRDYYSYRNLIYMLNNTFDKKKLAKKIALRALIKIPFGYLKGWKYGTENSKFMLNAVMDAYRRKLGKTY
ncbi:glycosyltransferase [Gillisia sp. Hel_I_29]|uniref:glycosyltransferase n=1 Tax=Gillisia sp. Hel_I_29 TaxID=1249975 RepID=UPI00055512A2|nr:glycosyltransferase [Gillisia sp. Hel_I_29]